MSQLIKGQIMDALQVKEIVLSNGLTVWLNEDHSLPKVFGAVVVKAGSKDCPNTGIAHYFEHIMFKGTDKIGTIDYKEEKVWLDSIAAQYDLLSQTKDNMKRADIQKEINRLSLHAADYAIPNEFPRLISRYGGSGLNAGTSYDFTIFYNFFSPQYIEQWSELNSERLIHPVFRLFQGELETVYEEKNMRNDNMMAIPIEKALQKVFGSHPYAFPIIGSSENLKNPRLSEMEAFFKKYYVATNMGLVLCGDFDAQSIMPLLEKTFGRIVRGNPIVRERAVLPPITEQKVVKIKLPVPMVKGCCFAFQGPVERDSDTPALNIAVALLSNENQTGFLDSLTNTHKVLVVGAMRGSLNDAGAVGFAVVPKMPFGSLAKAQKMAWTQIDRLKKGDFTEENLKSIKMMLLRKAESALESLDNRANKMMEIFTQNRTWADYLNQTSSIDTLTKEDIVRVANKYFTTSYIKFVKKFGSYPKDKIQKPDFLPIVPKNTNASSEYAKQLEQMPIQPSKPRLLNFDKDVQTIELTSHSSLYVTNNPVNDLFSLSLIYHKGCSADSRLALLPDYLTTLGTNSLTKQAWGEALQKLGTTFVSTSSENTFTLRISGFDRNFKPSLQLLRNFMEDAKNDEKSMKDLVSAYKVNSKAFDKSSDLIAEAMYEKVAYGDKSKYLSQLSIRDIKHTKGQELLELFKDILNTECSVVYCGRLAASEVAQDVSQNLPIDKAVRPSAFVCRYLNDSDTPKVFYYDMPTSRQTIIQTYQASSPLSNPDERAKMMLWGSYFGTGFSSLMFQEIREFRSYAYNASGTSLLPPLKYAGDHRIAYLTNLSTQADKTMFAISTLDFLFQEMPIREKNIETIKQEMINRINNNYPSFREIGEGIVDKRLAGYTEDPNTAILNVVPRLTMDDVTSFYNEYIVSKPRVIIIVGNKKDIPLDFLSKYGTLVEWKKNDIYK